MLKKSKIKRLFVATIFTMVVPFAFASITLTGTINEKAKHNKYSLKNLSSLSRKNFSLSILKTNLQYKGIFFINEKKLNSHFNSFMQFDNGNTTYVFPYRYIYKTPKFKIPSTTNN